MNIFGKVKTYTVYKCKNCSFGLTKGVELQKGDYHRDETYREEGKLFKNIFIRKTIFYNYAFIHSFCLVKTSVS